MNTMLPKGWLKFIMTRTNFRKKIIQQQCTCTAYNERTPYYMILFYI